MARPGPVSGRIAAQNRRARFDYFIDETLEAGIMLVGTGGEIPSCRQGEHGQILCG